MARTGACASCYVACTSAAGRVAIIVPITEVVDAAQATRTVRGEDVSRFYRFTYGIGFRPWEQDVPTVGRQLAGLLAEEEAQRERPYGSALDLGCGTGGWSVQLAQRGWSVVGVDVVPKAIRAARRRAEESGVDVTFIEGDVTELGRIGVGTGFSFILDVECFNHLNDAQRTAVGREVNANHVL